MFAAPGPYATALLLLLCVQTTHLDDIARAYEAALFGLTDLSLTEEVTTQSFHRVTRVTLIGKPAWKLWYFDLTHREGNRVDGRVGCFDGTHYWFLQADGMGMCVAEYNVPDTYMAFAGMSLAHLGLGPEREGGRHTLLRGRDMTVEDLDNRPGVVRLRADHWIRELDSRHGFMPIRVERPPSIRFEFSGYTQFGPLWLPRHIRRSGDEEFEIILRDVEVNRGVGAADIEVRFPFGTSILYDQDVTRVFGSANPSEAQEGLENWLAYSNWAGRGACHVKPVGDQAVWVSGAGWRPYYVGITVLSAVAFLAYSFARARKVAGRAALILCCSLGPLAAVGAETESELLDTGPSAACCTYLACALYGHEAPFAELLTHFGTVGKGASLRQISAALDARGIHTTNPRSLSLAQLEKWPYPVVLELRPRQAMPYTRYAIFTGMNEFGYTLIDPNPYGQLRPVTRERLLDLWSGNALLTSAVPIHVEDPWRVAISVSSLFLIASLLAFGATVIRRQRLLAPALFVGCVALAGGCGGDRQATRTPVGAYLDRTVWNVGETYPETVEQDFTLTNSSSSLVKIEKVVRSCGCMAANLPEGLELAPGGRKTFTLAIDLSGFGGPVTHTLRFEYSDGSVEELLVSATVKRGVFAEPSRLVFNSRHPGELVVREVELICDDEQPFEIVSAEAPLAKSVSYDNDARTVRVTMVNENRNALVTDTLTIGTTHPRSTSVHVPLMARFSLTWEARPPGLFFHEDDGAEFVERTVTLISKLAIPFVVKPHSEERVVIVPLDDNPGVSQPVRIRLRRPRVVGNPKREVVTLATTLPDDPTIDVSFIFYR